MAELGGFFFFVFLFLFLNRAQVGAQLWREGGDKRGWPEACQIGWESSWEEIAQKEREERTAREEGEGKKESKTGWVEEVEESDSVLQEKKEGERVGEADIKG